jgi:sensor histidine kinase YesM
MGSIPSDRVGLANANERLRLMIGPSASLKLDLSRPQHAVATVRIPQLLSAAPEQALPTD